MSLRRKIYEVIEVADKDDRDSLIYDRFMLVCIAASIVPLCFKETNALFIWLDRATVTVFIVDYLLRWWTADLKYEKSGKWAFLRYPFSFFGIVDLLSILPSLTMLSSGFKLFRLFRLNKALKALKFLRYSHSFELILNVIKREKRALAAVCVLAGGYIALSALIMFQVEPDSFDTFFDAIYWAVVTLTTVGYGDIYPVTTMGKIFSIFITFLGVGMVAIPTGIISAGFVDQYTRIKRISEYADEDEVHFIRVALTEHDSWSGKTIQQLGLPHGVIVVAIQRGHEVVVPRGSVELMADDVLVLGAESVGSSDQHHIELKELELRQHNPWNGQRIRDLDISRQTLIVIVKRKGRMLIPNGDLTLHQGDRVILYASTRMAHASSIWL